MPFGIGFPELLILLVVLLLLFGAKRLPEMGRSLGKGMREFKEGVTGFDDDEPAEATPPPKELTPPATDVERANSDPNTVRAALESLSEEDRRAVMESVAADSRPASGSESEQEAVS